MHSRSHDKPSSKLSWCSRVGFLGYLLSSTPTQLVCCFLLCFLYTTPLDWHSDSDLNRIKSGARRATRVFIFGIHNRSARSFISLYANLILSRTIGSLEGSM
jgi:hypothetical protein